MNELTAGQVIEEVRTPLRIEPQLAAHACFQSPRNVLVVPLAFCVLESKF